MKKDEKTTIESSTNNFTENDKEKIRNKPEVRYESDGRIITDPLGSWTGVPTDSPFDTPIQDVDDL